MLRSSEANAKEGVRANRQMDATKTVKVLFFVFLDMVPPPDISIGFNPGWHKESLIFKDIAVYSDSSTKRVP